MKIPLSSAKVFFILWLLCFIASFSLPFLLEAKGDGFTKGLNRISALMMWQLAASVFSLVVLIASFGPQSNSARARWVYRIPAIIQFSLIAAVVSFIVFENTKRPPSDPYPPATTAPAQTTAPTASPIEPIQEPTNPHSVDTFSGIYRSGFEASHFYAMDGRGPWWVEFEGDAGDSLHALVDPTSNRGDMVRVALQVSGWLSDDTAELNHLGNFENKLTITSVKSARALTAEEFEQVKMTVQRHKKQ